MSIDPFKRKSPKARIPVLGNVDGVSYTMTQKQRMKREQEVRAMLDEGMAVSEIAEKLGRSTQAIYKFMKVRGWKAKTS